MPNPDILTLDPNPPPDWDARSTDLLCPLCQYNLRHLTTARCPECGFAFKWSELLAAEKEQHSYVFEQGRGISIGKFFKTYFRTCRPRKFWTDLSPAQPVRLDRLMVYCFITFGVVAICMAGPNGRSIAAVTQNAVELAKRSAAVRAQMTARAKITPAGVSTLQFKQMQSLLNSYAPLPWQLHFWRIIFSQPMRRYPGYRWRHNEPSAASWAAVFFAWPFLTLASLLVFRLSMRQAKIRTAYLLRTVIYACDFGLLLVAGFTAFSFVDTNLADGWLIMVAVLLCSIVTGYRLSIAFKKYLRVHLPLATVLASQIIVVLALFLLLVQMVDFSRRI